MESIEDKTERTDTISHNKISAFSFLWVCSVEIQLLKQSLQRIVYPIRICIRFAILEWLFFLIWFGPLALFGARELAEWNFFFCFYFFMIPQFWDFSALLFRIIKGLLTPLLDFVFESQVGTYLLSMWKECTIGIWMQNFQNINFNSNQVWLTITDWFVLLINSLEIEIFNGFQPVSGEMMRKGFDWFFLFNHNSPMTFIVGSLGISVVGWLFPGLLLSFCLRSLENLHWRCVGGSVILFSFSITIWVCVLWTFCRFAHEILYVKKETTHFNVYFQALMKRISIVPPDEKFKIDSAYPSFFEIGCFAKISDVLGESPRQLNFVNQFQGYCMQQLKLPREIVMCIEDYCWDLGPVFKIDECIYWNPVVHGIQSISWVLHTHERKFLLIAKSHQQVKAIHSWLSFYGQPYDLIEMYFWDFLPKCRNHFYEVKYPENLASPAIWCMGIGKEKQQPRNKTKIQKEQFDQDFQTKQKKEEKQEKPRQNHRQNKGNFDSTEDERKQNFDLLSTLDISSKNSLFQMAGMNLKQVDNSKAIGNTHRESEKEKTKKRRKKKVRKVKQET